MNVKQCYLDADALLEGHFLLSSGNHSNYYLQSAKVLENPKIAEVLAKELAFLINDYFRKIKIDYICSPALGGIIAGYELARALGVKSIFTERVNGVMNLRRGFNVTSSNNVLICEDIITTGGSAIESAKCIQNLGAKVIGFAALANRGFCKKINSNKNQKAECKLPYDLPFFSLEDFEFEMYEPANCPMCKNGSAAIKPGSRVN